MDEEAKARPASLDPSNWLEFKAAARSAVDRLFNDLADYDKPVWRPLPSEARKKLVEAPLPLHSTPLDVVLDEVFRDIVPFRMGNTHPRFWGWVNGSALPVGVIGDLIASGMNNNVTLHDHCGMHVELQTLTWLKQALDLPASHSGLFVSGGSMANFTALAVARDAALDPKERQSGLSGAPPLVAYASSQSHNSIIKAIMALGLGREGLAEIAVDSDYRIDVDQLKGRIAADRRAGRRPFAIVANVGTVNTGAIDSITELSELAQRERLWLHVDGAFGAMAWLDPRQRSQLQGLQQADSIAGDAHKWLYQPYACAFVFIKDESKHRAAFTIDAPYLAQLPDAEPTITRFIDLGLELSRPLRAFKLWLTLKTHGIDAIAAAIAKNIDQIALLGSLIDREPELELLAPITLNVACFRYVAPGCSLAALNELNLGIITALHNSGAAMPSYTTLDGAFCIRAANVNHRTHDEDVRFLVEEVLRLGRELSRSPE